MPGLSIVAGLPTMSPFIGGQSGARHSAETWRAPGFRGTPSGVAFSIARLTVTFVQRSVQDGAIRPANDNDSPTEVPSVLDLIPSADDDNVADIVRRTERLAIAVVIGMAIFLVLAPVVFFAISYGI